MNTRWLLPALALLLSACAHAPDHTRAGGAVTWRLDSLANIGGVTPEVLGAPRLERTKRGRVLCFDGQADGIFLPVKPIAGWERFTIEVLFKPAGEGPREQRFLHIQDDSERRVLIETRVNGRQWALDTFLRASETDKLTLLDPARTQSTDDWQWAALVYDGATMAHYVNGVRQLEGAVRFPPMGPGRISLGVRQNRIHWFKGCLAEVRFTPRALVAAELRQVNRP